MMKSAKELLVTNIRNKRLERSWSQMKLAEESSLSTGMIGDIETGKKTPSLESLDKIAAAFNIPVHYLLRDPELLVENEIAKSNRQKIDKAIELLDSLELD